MFYHAYDNYMQHAYPKDELLPISCRGVDNFGGYALTLIDSLTTLAIIGNKTEFARAIDMLSNGRLSFDTDMSGSHHIKASRIYLVPEAPSSF